MACCCLSLYNFRLFFAVEYEYEYEHDPCPFVFGWTPPWALEAGIPEYLYHEKVNQPHSLVRCLGHARLRTAADLPFIPCQELGET